MQPTRAEVIAETVQHLEEMRGDLDAARERDRWSAVSSMHNGIRQLRRELLELLPDDEDKDQEDMTPAEIAQALAGGILELPDDVLPVIESALRERRRNGLRLVSG